MPGTDGLSFCRSLKIDPGDAQTSAIVLLDRLRRQTRTRTACGADAFLRKPFSPLELLNSSSGSPAASTKGRSATADEPPEEQLILYAQDLRRLLEVERGQRALIQSAYQETVTALAGALESKDTGTGAHSKRVQRYAIELARSIDPALLDDPSLEYGFLLHDVGKIGIPDKILQKPGSLTPRSSG